ncbi:MAG TPA: galactose-1-phosphate uridylyltransferase [Candidatus Polarisedimenticolia bacterium]|nr:galactose-1-phosphate uridylyltransferase [Candidatus Polarisedimenticolia bacterium]
MISELRKDPVIGRWVIIAGERSQRPNPFRQYTPVAPSGDPCPFCPGREGMTPPEVLAYRYDEGTANAPRWKVRVVPNRYPALRIEGTLDKSAEGLYDKMRGIGAHEVVIETPDHDTDPTRYTARQVVDVINAYRDRVTDLLHDVRFRYVLIFKNHGAAAGATLAHPHSQIIALPIVPVRIQTELQGAGQYFDYRGRCVYCDILTQEIADGRRLVVQNADFVAFTPFASRFPFEVSILPRNHDAFFWGLTKHQMEGLAEILQDVLRRCRLALNDPPYNYIIHTAPPGYANPERYHWQVEVIPKLTDVAGFEWGSGFFINPTLPEEAARHLRELEQFMDVPQGHLLARPDPDPAPGPGERTR